MARPPDQHQEGCELEFDASIKHSAKHSVESPLLLFNRTEIFSLQKCSFTPACTLRALAVVLAWAKELLCTCSALNYDRLLNCVWLKTLFVSSLSSNCHRSLIRVRFSSARSTVSERWLYPGAGECERERVHFFGIIAQENAPLKAEFETVRTLDPGDIILDRVRRVGPTGSADPFEIGKPFGPRQQESWQAVEPPVRQRKLKPSRSQSHRGGGIEVERIIAQAHVANGELIDQLRYERGRGRQNQVLRPKLNPVHAYRKLRLKLVLRLLTKEVGAAERVLRPQVVVNPHCRLIGLGAIIAGDVSQPPRPIRQRKERQIDLGKSMKPVWWNPAVGKRPAPRVGNDRVVIWRAGQRLRPIAEIACPLFGRDRRHHPGQPSHTPRAFVIGKEKRLLLCPHYRPKASESAPQSARRTH